MSKRVTGGVEFFSLHMNFPLLFYVGYKLRVDLATVGNDSVQNGSQSVPCLERNGSPVSRMQ